MIRRSVILLACVCAPVLAQPTPLPDDDTESFILRWNEWANATDPDRSAINALQQAVNGANEAMRQVPSIHGEGAARNAIENPFYHPDNWPLAQRAAEAIAPHCERVRARLAVPTLAFRYDVPEQGAEFTFDDDRPTNHAEAMQMGEQIGPDSAWAALILLQLETDFAKHSGNIGLVAENTLATVHAARLLGEQPDVLSHLYAAAVAGSAISMTEWLLMKPQAASNSALLERLQTGLLALYRLDRTWSRALAVQRLVQQDLLVSCFEPDAPGVLTPRGRFYFDSTIKADEAFGLGNRGWFSMPDVPALDSTFAPSEEQIRVYGSIMDALEQDLAQQRQTGAERLMSAQAYGEVLERTDAPSLAPALSMFALAESKLVLEIRWETENRAILVTLAVFRHCARHGHWPVLLDTIDEDLLPIAPIDPYTGKLFGYTIRDDLPVIWSAGPDRDDDGGRRFLTTQSDALWFNPAKTWMPMAELKSLPPEQQARLDGDIVFFPPKD